MVRQVFLSLLLFLSSSALLFAENYPRNLIIIIGDGMGPEQIRAAEMYKGSPLLFKSFPHQAMVTTYALDNPITDSAAAAGAIATGHKHENRVISTRKDESLADVIIDFGASWSYYDGAAAPGTTWYDSSFDDSSWTTGSAHFGYGDGDEATIINFGGDSNNKRITSYYRKTFLINNLQNLKDIRLNLVRDDGARVFINGQEVFRTNLPEGEITHTTTALTAIGGSAESTSVQPHFFDKALLQEGENLIAVEIHQANVSSSDISFDLQLLADDFEYASLLEIFKAQGKSTGLVTNSSITDATPASFGAHELSRSFSDAIASDYVLLSKPNLLIGGSSSFLTALSQANGYQVVNNEAAFLSVADDTPFLHGAFGNGYMPFAVDGLGLYPSLKEMTEKALTMLSRDDDGFFLLIENEHIDTSGHSNDILRNVTEVLELEQAVSSVVSWLGSAEDTLVLVTADHETGGLSILQDNGIGVLPSVTWSTTGHTAKDVNLFALGQGAELFFDTVDNTDLFGLIANVPELPEAPQPTPLPSTSPSPTVTPTPGSNPGSGSGAPGLQLSHLANFKMRGNRLRLSFELVGKDSFENCSCELFQFSADGESDLSLGSFALRSEQETFFLKMPRMKQLPRRKDQRLSQIKSILRCSGETVSEQDYQKVRGLSRGNKFRSVRRNRWFRLLSKQLARKEERQRPLSP